MLRLDFTYGEDLSHDEGDNRAQNKMHIIIIGRNQRAARNSFLKICLTFLAKRQREKYNVSLKIRKMEGYMKNVISRNEFKFAFSPKRYPYHFILYNSAVL